ncbi:MAG TPA: shikimate kinase [Armatimonadetes bacterium]|nr:shikimate kinase [Armatimonadota bacterium]
MSSLRKTTSSLLLKERNIVLVGFMAAGKTCVGRALAAALGWTFIDTDDLIVAREGCPIPEIFAAKGEGYFRELERKVVQEVAGQEKMVIACGGGVVKDETNVALLKRRGWIVYLYASPEALTERLLREPGRRPLIDNFVPNRDPAAVRRRGEALLAERTVLYERAADWIVDTSGRTPEEIREVILSQRGREVWAMHCPYLGTRHDPLTRYGYPTGQNVCWSPGIEKRRGRDYGRVGKSHQERYCLTDEHVHCPYYEEEEPGE